MYSSVFHVTLVCLVFASNVDAFFAPFLHKPPTSWDDDIVAPSRARRDVFPAITPNLLDHSSDRTVTMDQRDNSSSMFMVELFESLYTGHNLVSPSPQECQAIQSSDTVRSYTAHVQSKIPFLKFTILCYVLLYSVNVKLRELSFTNFSSSKSYVVSIRLYSVNVMLRE